jgi:hypothetical protein
MPISTLLILALLVGAAAWYWIRTAGPSRSSESQLHRICHGNRMQADRLIEGELSRAPGISRVEAARRAVERYQRDNR